MNTPFVRPFFSIPLLLASAAPCAAQPVVSLSPVVVTGHHSEQPLTIIVDPRAPAQPMPAQDGADLLRGIPGFSIIRKAGADGDPVLRGAAGSRLGILVDGDTILGGCGNRMDPPTAYVHPAAFERVVVIKGPQSVLNGSGYSAGVVRFERDPHAAAGAGNEFAGSVTIGSFGRNDEMGRARVAGPRAFVALVGTRSAADDYTGGDGERVHSAYERWNAQMTAGWTPTAHTALEFVSAWGDGEATYADRAMDGTKFARRHHAVHFTHAEPVGSLRRVEARAFYSYVDHVMDNFSLRRFTGTGAMAQRAVSNPDRRTYGGRSLATLELAAANVDAGVDLQVNEHRVRSTGNELMNPLAALARTPDARFRQAGLFAEASRGQRERDRWVGGIRVDDWRADDHRNAVSAGMGGTLPNPTSGQRRHRTLGSAFVRHERGPRSLTLYAGAGYTERFPDYWEMIAKESAASVSAFATRPERTAQLDAGLLVQRSALSASLSLFANRSADFILIQSGVRKGMRVATIARNIDAAAWGAEATAAVRFAPGWTVDASLAHVQGENRTDRVPLAQQPPLEARLGINYATARWSAGALTRAVASQSRFAANQGNIAGQDFAATPGFAVVSLNGGWSFARHARLAAGVDNLFDRAYAEHISRSGAAIPGYTQTRRVMEPGRTLWVRLDLAY